MGESSPQLHTSISPSQVPQAMVAFAWTCCWGCLALPVPPKRPGWQLQEVPSDPREGGMLLLWARQVLPWSQRQLCPHTMAKGAPRGALLQPQCAILKQPSRRAQPVGGMWSGPLSARMSPCVSGLAARRVTPARVASSTPSPGPARHLLFWPNQAPALASGNVGVMPRAWVTFPLQVLPARSSLLPCSPSLPAPSRSRAGGGKGEIMAEDRCVCGVCEDRCAAMGLGNKKGRGEVWQSRGVFSLSVCVCVCAQARAFPAPERCSLQRSCLLWPHPRGLSPG